MPGTTSFVSTEEGYSNNHFPLNTDGDDGGPWLLHRVWDKPTVGQYVNSWYDGQFVLRWPSTYTLPGAPTMASDSLLDARGTTAIARTAPTSPAYSLQTALGELASDGLPSAFGASLIKERAKLARGAGSEYLNSVFGWLPLLSDVRSFAATVKQSGKILDQYRKDSGAKVRRGYDFPISDTFTSLASGAFQTTPLVAATQGGVGPQGGNLTTRVFERQWFRGAFKYHIPIAEDTLGKFAEWTSMADHLLGVRVTPETLWNIAPWSWAVDWFSNTGDILANVSNLGKDGLVLQYGYSMSHRLRESRMSAVYKPVDTGLTISLSRHVLDEWKQRKRATPYGFGVDSSALSAKQIAVIAALGLSKT